MFWWASLYCAQNRYLWWSDCLHAPKNLKLFVASIFLVFDDSTRALTMPVAGPSLIWYLNRSGFSAAHLHVTLGPPVALARLLPLASPCRLPPSTRDSNPSSRIWIWSTRFQPCHWKWSYRQSSPPWSRDIRCVHGRFRYHYPACIGRGNLLHTNLLTAV